MSDIAISSENIGKRYWLGKGESYKTLRESLSGRALNLFSHLHSRRGVSNLSAEQNVWALKDVSFEIKSGEIIGVIGRNGAGKSTLLKLLSRVTKPTEGCFRVAGNVGALLEVGVGFHPELTGRENVYLSGAILGIRKQEVKRKFDRIVDFAEVENFIDVPVKRYRPGCICA